MTGVREFRKPGPPPGWVPRPQRFDVKTVIRYRKTGEPQWHEGFTENISGSGVLFRAAHAMHPKTAVEMTFSLPRGASGRGAGGAGATEVHCRGYIVREVALKGIEVGLAARITKYRLLRAQPPPA